MGSRAAAPGMLPPMHSSVSGEQFELRHGPHRAVVTEVGATLRVCELSGYRVLDGSGLDSLTLAARGQVLAPWPNRIDGGRYEWAGVEEQLALTEPLRGNAIHGLVRWAPFSVAELTDSRVTMAAGVFPQMGYPFSLRLRVSYELDDRGLAVSTAVSNVGPTSAPWGLGFHPYLTAGSDHIDGDVLTVPAHAVIATNDRLIPTGDRLPVAETPFDFRTGRVIGDVAHTSMDTCFTDVQRDQDGLAWVTLSSPTSGRTVCVWMDEQFPYVMLVTGDFLPAALARRSLAIEPMTCPANAFPTGEGLVTLAPGESWTARWGVALRT